MPNESQVCFNFDASDGDGECTGMKKSELRPLGVLSSWFNYYGSSWRQALAVVVVIIMCGMLYRTYDCSSEFAEVVVVAIRPKRRDNGNPKYVLVSISLP